jgi:hypothetical protein
MINYPGNCPRSLTQLRVLNSDYRGTGVTATSLILGPVKNTGVSARTLSETGLTASTAFSVSPQKVAAPTLRAIGKPRAEIVVSIGPSRLLKALMDYFPALGPAINRLSGADKLMASVADHREAARTHPARHNNSQPARLPTFAPSHAPHQGRIPFPRALPPGDQSLAIAGPAREEQHERELVAASGVKVLVGCAVTDADPEKHSAGPVGSFNGLRAKGTRRIELVAGAIRSYEERGLSHVRHARCARVLPG